MPQINDLTSVSSLSGTEELPVVQSASTKKATVNDLLGYKVYTGLIAYNTLSSQMVIQTFKDTFGDLSFSRLAAGQYKIESAGGLFEDNKTQIFISQDNNTGGAGDGNFVYYVSYRNNSSSIYIQAYDVDVTNGGSTLGDFLSNMSIEIRVYP